MLVTCQENCKIFLSSIFENVPKKLNYKPRIESGLLVCKRAELNFVD